MVFMCQHDSYLKSYSTKVVACQVADCKIPNNKGVLSKTPGFFVELEDTILFPEGGGQPDDYGTINGVAVKRVVRKGAKALHFVEEKLEVGDNAEVAVDWSRRFDHMQQHSAQHLISAIADIEFGFHTTSWDLGKTVSSIELDTAELNQNHLNHIENLVNQAIRNHLPVEVHVTDVGSPLLESVRTRGLPDDHVGDVRIVEIKNIEANMCCGTHVANLSHLQLVKILSAEKAKKGKSNLFFLAGNRVLNYAEKSHDSDRKMNKLLKCGPDEHVAMLEKSVSQLKVAQKQNTTLLRRVALLEAGNLKKQSDDKKLFCLHQKEGNNEFMNIIANEIGPEMFLFLTVGDEKGKGMFLISGPSSFVGECGPGVVEIIAGKGQAKGTRMQGKADKLQRKEEAIRLCEKYIKDNETN